MSDDCPTCPPLQAQIGQLIGGIASITALIDYELDKPTMTRQQLIHTVRARLAATTNPGT